MKIELKSIQLPDFGLPTNEPSISKELYEHRVQKVRNKMKERNLDAIVVYADREHNANLTYLTGYDPRFEEAVLILTKDNTPALLVGNEGMGYAELCPSKVKSILYQPLSLLGQSRDESSDFSALLKNEGIRSGWKVGIAGWKYFNEKEFKNPEFIFETPSYIVDELRNLTGDNKNVFNVNDLFMNPDNGLRIINEAEQLASFEFAASHTSAALKNVLWGIRPGMTELEAATLMKINGLPNNCHLMLSSGHRATFGLASPSMNTIKVGDRFTMAFGIWGALNARAGWMVHDETELPSNIKDYVNKLAIPYFKAVAHWYEHIGIGVTGGELYDIIHTHIGDPFFGIHLNPGHFIHIDEWVHSAVFKGSTIPLKSGMAIQVDVIPATGSDYHTINIEDGIALADENLRNEIAKKFPETWSRIQARRKFMQEVIGITLKPEVLPFSNIPAYLPPFVLSPQKALAVVK